MIPDSPHRTSSVACQGKSPAADRYDVNSVQRDYNSKISKPLYFDKKDGDPDHHNSKDAIDDGDVVCGAGVIEMSTNNENGTATANAHRQMLNV